MPMDPYAKFNRTLFARTLVGLILAPVVGGGTAMLVMGLTEATQPDFGIEELASIIMLGGIFGGIFGLVPALVLGWPIHLLLLRQRWTQVWFYIGTGAVLGVAAMFATPFAMEIFGV